MNEHKLYQRLIAMIVSVFMVLGMLPVSVFAETYLERMGGEIVAFEALPEETASQEVALGTSLDDLDLPSSLMATVRLTAADVQDSGEDVQDSGVVDSGEAPEDSAELTIPVPVTWNPEPDYDGDTVGTYVFTADAGDLIVDTELPEITVTVQAISMMTASAVLRSGTTVNKSYETMVGATLEMDINDLTGIADILYFDRNKDHPFQPGAKIQRWAKEWSAYYVAQRKRRNVYAINAHVPKTFACPSSSQTVSTRRTGINIRKQAFWLIQFTRFRLLENEIPMA